MVAFAVAGEFFNMCGRFNIIDDPLTQLIMEITGVTTGWSFDTSLKTEFNIAPTQTVPVLTYADNAGWNLPLMRWWLVPSWSPEPSTKYSMFNAKSETLAKSRAYREPFKNKRCIIPVSGYYEWKKEGAIKVPYYIEPERDAGFAMAGLWDRWHRGDQIIESCTIVTAAAPESMQQVHHRIPVHLTVEQARQWVSGDTDSSDLNALLAPEIRTTIRITPVSNIVNNARNKDERCIEPLGDGVTVH
jgi:putative SOS response-associated peptidase YedK